MEVRRGRVALLALCGAGSNLDYQHIIEKNSWRHTVDGRNPANQLLLVMVNIPFFYKVLALLPGGCWGFLPSQLVFQWHDTLQISGGTLAVQAEVHKWLWDCGREGSFPWELHGVIPFLKPTFFLKIDPKKRGFLLESTIFQGGTVSFREGHFCQLAWRLLKTPEVFV